MLLSIKIYKTHPRVGSAALLADWSFLAKGLIFDTNSAYGFGQASFTVPMPRAVARHWYGRLANTHLHITWCGCVVYEGRVEQPATIAGGLQVTALGYKRALADVIQATRWSSSTLSDWEVLETAIAPSRMPSEYSFSTEDLLLISANSGGAFDGNRAGSLHATFGTTASRSIQTFEASYSFIAPTGWVAVLQAFTSAWSYIGNLWAVNGTGAAQAGSISLASLSAPRLVLSLLLNRTATTMHALAATAYAVGASVVITPASMTGIVKGNKLWLGGTNPEETTVTAVTATTFTCELRYAHTGADAISFVSEHKDGDVKVELTNVRIKATNSAAVYADEVTKDLIAQTVASNPTQLNPSGVLVASPGVDLKTYGYDPEYPLAVIDRLADMGDTVGRQWAARVWERQLLQLQPVTAETRVYDFRREAELTRDVDTLWTHVIPRYLDANGDEAQAATQSNQLAVLRHGLRRNLRFDAPETSSLATVASLAATKLADVSVMQSQGDVTVDALYHKGARMPLFLFRAGMTARAVEFPTTGNQALDGARSFRVCSTTYDHDAGTLTLSPAERADTIEALLARRDAQGVTG